MAMILMRFNIYACDSDIRYNDISLHYCCTTLHPTLRKIFNTIHTGVAH